MKPEVCAAGLALVISASFASGQQIDRNAAPIYNVTVVQPSITAVTYRYRAGPTIIDFRGTVLLPEARGEATVESKQGRTEISVHLNHVTPPQRFGNEYLTYVLWAISPEGRPNNLGEVVPGRSGNASLRVTTVLTTFAMFVTAESYSAVRQPGDVVVLENQRNKDSVGGWETVYPKRDLLPRGQYTWNVSDGISPVLADSPEVSSKEYDALLELYEAENAVTAAANAGAEKYAAGTFARAKKLLKDAQEYFAKRYESRLVVETALEAAQAAEDARMLARQRQQEEDLRTAQTALSRAQANASAAQQVGQRQTDTALAASSQAEAPAVADSAAEARVAALRPQATIPGQAKALRRGLLEDLNNVLPARDTPRGLIVTITDNGFSGETLNAAGVAQTARIAAILASRAESHRRFNVRVEGYSDRAGGSQKRAEAVLSALLDNGLSATVVSAAGMGGSPVVSQDWPQGPEESSRVEIVISGDEIAEAPFFDDAYPLTRRR